MKTGKIAVLCFCTAVSAVSLCSCGTKYDTEQRFIYVDRASLEDKDPSEILSQAVDLERMEKEKEQYIGIRLTFNPLNNGVDGDPRLRIANSAGFINDCRADAYQFLTRTRAYRVVMLDPVQVSKDKLYTSEKINGDIFHFCIDMNLSLTSEVKQGYDSDEALCKATLTWTLIDRRTKSNGLGELDVPVASEANICRSMNVMDLRISSISGYGSLSGENRNRAMNRYKNAAQNALYQFMAQLINRIPYGGKVREMWALDDKVCMRLADADKMGLVKGMQTLIMDNRGNKVALATATGGRNGMNLEVWRWLSKSLKTRILKAVESDESAEAYLKKEKNRLYAVVLGMPAPSKDTITNFNDTKD